MCEKGRRLAAMERDSSLVQQSNKRIGLENAAVEKHVLALTRIACEQSLTNRRVAERARSRALFMRPLLTAKQDEQACYSCVEQKVQSARLGSKAPERAGACNHDGALL